MKRVLLLGLVLAALVGGFTVWARWRTTNMAANLPAAPVREGVFNVIVRCRGELRARRTRQIAAPVNVPDLRIVWLAPAGTAVKAGDPIIRFDPSSMQQQLQEKQATLRQTEAALKQAKAEGEIGAEQDKREQKESAYQVERAKLEVSRQEVVAKLKGEESRVDLSVAENKLSVQHAKTALNVASTTSRLASLARQREKANDEVELAEYRLGRLEVRAPQAGMIIFLSNYSQGWMNAKPFKVGDQVWPGAVVGEIPDLETLEMEAKVEEIDRGRVQVGLEARIKVDAFPEKVFTGEVDLLSPLTEVGWEWPPTRSFRGYARIKDRDARLRPGMNGELHVVERRIEKALSVPSKAVFTRQGKPVVFVLAEGQPQLRYVEIEARNPDEVAVKGLRAGQQVLLVDPTGGDQKKGGTKP